MDKKYVGKPVHKWIRIEEAIKEERMDELEVSKDEVYEVFEFLTTAEGRERVACEAGVDADVMHQAMFAILYFLKEK